MSYQLQYPNYSKALYQSLQDMVYFQALGKACDVADVDEALTAYIDYSLVEAKLYGRLFLPDEHQQAYQKGASIWSLPLDEATARQKSLAKLAFVEQTLGASAFAAYQKIVNFMTEAEQGLVADNSWYLSILGVMPAHQGKGVGPQLVTPILAEADELGVSTYLETFTPRNHSFYQRLGFEVVATIYEPTVAADYAIMVRVAP